MTLLDIAKNDLEAARILSSSSLSEDEGGLNLVAYHLQQAVKKTLKYQLEINGYEYKKGHSIEQIILQIRQIRETADITKTVNPPKTDAPVVKEPKI